MVVAHGVGGLEADARQAFLMIPCASFFPYARYVIDKDD
jgi:preprotein translocase subunit SecB|tara:strand:- start:2150 stop:2266 length:117 start_codon:yes stop_codon:yes gene_type:complete